jgi:hypothetical protein
MSLKYVLAGCSERNGSALLILVGCLDVGVKLNEGAAEQLGDERALVSGAQSCGGWGRCSSEEAGECVVGSWGCCWLLQEGWSGVRIGCGGCSTSKQCFESRYSWCCRRGRLGLSGCASHACQKSCESSGASSCATT